MNSCGGSGIQSARWIRIHHEGSMSQGGPVDWFVHTVPPGTASGSPSVLRRVPRISRHGRPYAFAPGVFFQMKRCGSSTVSVLFFQGIGSSVVTQLHANVSIRPAGIQLPSTIWGLLL